MARAAPSGPFADIAKLLRAARERRGVTQEQMADELGRKQPQIARWEAGKALPPTEDVRAVARSYRLAPEQLLPRPSREAKAS